MLIDELMAKITDQQTKIQDDWMPATAVRPFILDDPALVWLDYHGESNGFKPQKSPYDFLDFIAGKGREFEEKWISELVSAAVVVCTRDYEVRSLDKVRETVQLLLAGAPAIAKPGLWYGPERIYGVPDLIVHTSWLEENFPQLVGSYERNSVAANLFTADKPGHYVVFDIKFTTRLDETDKKKDYANYSAQVRIYSYALGHLQGWMPRYAYLVTRDRLSDPLPASVISNLGQPLDSDLSVIRDQFIEIKLNGSKYLPWKDRIVASNLSNEDEQWGTAKKIIALEKFPGRDSALLYQVGPGIKRELDTLGFPSLDSMLKVDPARIPFEKCTGLGPKRSKVMRAIVEANRSGNAIQPSASLVPLPKTYELFVDFEYLTNVNVDFETQWPTLEGHEMVFMIGVGQIKAGRWSFTTFIAEAENSQQESEMFRRFLDHLDRETGGSATDPSKTALYHWTSAEVWQARRSSDRLAFAPDHPLRALPWFDLQKPFTEGPAALPGAWNYGLKNIAYALGKLRPDLSVQWPEGLEEGLRAMVMGWRAYSMSDPINAPEMAVLNKYLEADCAALSAVLKWLRS
jgi:hypothetical protein